MSLARGITENPKTFYPFIKSERVARERVGPVQDNRRNVIMMAEKWTRLLMNCLHQYSQRIRALMMVRY